MHPTTDLFRKGWRKFPTGVSLITTIDDRGEVHGMTANGILSVSLDPLLNLVSVGFQAQTLGYLQQTKRYGMSLLRYDQMDVAVYYAERPEDRVKLPKPPGLKLVKAGNSYKVDGALAYMDCKVVSTHQEGDHILFIGLVEGMEVGEGDPLLFYEGTWRGLGPPSSREKPRPHSQNEL